MAGSHPSHKAKDVLLGSPTSMDHRAFTLIELLLVLAVIAILTLVIKRNEIVHANLDDPGVPVVTVENVRVYSVSKDPNDSTGKSIIIMTYQIVNRSVLFAAVYLGNLQPASYAANLHHDDRVSIVGGVFAYEPRGERPAEAVRFYGAVVPVRQNAPVKK